MIKKISRFKHFGAFLDASFVLVAMFVALYARMHFVDFSAAVNYYFYDGARIFTTTEAYHYATAARDLAQGHLGDSFYPRYVLQMPTILGAMLGYILPLSQDDLFFLLPVWLSSLVAIPSYLWAKRLTNRYFALFAAILVPLCAGYSARTVGGFYGVDMLGLFFLLFGLYFLHRLLGAFSFASLLSASLFFLLSVWWDGASAAPLFLAIVAALIYVLLKNKGDLGGENARIYGAFGVLLVSVSPVPLFLQIILLAPMLHLVAPKPFLFADFTANFTQRFPRKSLFMLIFGFLVFVAANLLALGADAPSADSAIRFKAAADELKISTLESLGSDTMGDVVTFWLGFLGAIVLFVRQRSAIVLLPLLFLTLASLKMGTRFTLFGAPILSIGFFYLLYSAFGLLGFALKDRLFLGGTKAVLLLCFAAFAIVPSFYRTLNNVVPPIVLGYEIKALDEIGKDSTNRGDVTISWWYDGALVPYFSHTRAFVDSGNHDAQRTFISSFILSSHSQRAAYNMAKLAAFGLDFAPNLMDWVLQNYGAAGNPKRFVESLQDSAFQAPKIAHNTYLYLPLSILTTQTAIDEFSDIDYESGEVLHKEEDKTLAQYSRFQRLGDIYLLDGEYEFSPADGTLRAKSINKSLQVQKFHIVGDSGVVTTSYNDDKNKLHIIYNKELEAFFAIDEHTNASLSVQMLVYGNYDRELFELVYGDKFAKAFRLK